MKMRRIVMVGVIGVAAAVGGCTSENFLKRRQDIPRADLGLDALAARVNGGREGVPPDVDVMQEQAQDKVVGTYEFAVPKTVTEIRKTGPEWAQYQLYFGTPAPADRPIVNIMIGPKVESEAAAGTGDLKAEKNRIYSLNGLQVQEWTGHTVGGLPFCELIISHGESGDKLHAVAVARDVESRKVALDVLGSISWKAK